MKRIDVRSKENWQRFDFWAVIIFILLLLLILLSWLAGARFGGEDCCKDDVVEEPIPAVVAPEPEPVVVPEPVVEVPEPVVVPKEDYALNFFKAGKNVVLEGTVADLATRNKIIADARERFGADNVISNLRINVNTLGFNTENLPSMFSQLSDVNDFRLTINPGKWSVFGQLSDSNLFERLGSSLAAISGFEVDNQLTLVEAEPVIDCESMLSLNSVEFALNSAEITDAGKQAIAQVMMCLSNNSYNIVGHTDSSGDADANQALSMARATAVREYLNILGVNTRDYTVTGKGESEPLIEGNSLEANNRNRRVEFKPL